MTVATTSAGVNIGKLWAISGRDSGTERTYVAETVGSALNMYQADFPDVEVTRIALEGISSTEVVNWDSVRYGNGLKCDSPVFDLCVVDNRTKNGQLHIDVAAQGGSVDDLMCLTVEVSRIPGTDTDTQSVRLSFDGDNVAAVIYKQADTYIIQLENGVVIEEAILGNGESGYVIK